MSTNLGWPEFVTRVMPAGGQVLNPWLLALVIALALVLTGTPWLWLRLRLLITLVHELGHAGVGVAVGRRFTGLVIRPDMSGHAVTVGRPRGLGLVATMWAGYPAPALVGALLVWAAGRGWAGPLLTAAILALLISLIRVRSVVTALVFVATGIGLGMAWWFQTGQVYLLVGLGVVLLVGAWRHVLAVARRRTSADDAAVLTRLTRVPRVLWVGSFFAVCAAATAAAAHTIYHYVAF